MDFERSLVTDVSLTGNKSLTADAYGLTLSTVCNPDEKLIILLIIIVIIRSLVCIWLSASIPLNCVIDFIVS